MQIFFTGFFHDIFLPAIEDLISKDIEKHFLMDFLKN